MLPSIISYRPHVPQAEFISAGGLKMEWRLRPPFWSICIPTVPERRGKLQRCLDRILPQVVTAYGDVEVLVHETPLAEGFDSVINSIGQKRNTLLASSHADYVSFVDDDDLVSKNYVSSILSCLNNVVEPDVVTFQVAALIKEKAGTNITTVLTRFNLDYGHRETPDGFERLPNHVGVWRRALCLPYQEVMKGEDTEWSYRMSYEQKKRGVPYTHISIEEPLYEYRHDHRDSIQFGNVGQVSVEAQDRTFSETVPPVEIGELDVDISCKRGVIS